MDRLIDGNYLFGLNQILVIQMLLQLWAAYRLMLAMDKTRLNSSESGDLTQLYR